MRHSVFVSDKSRLAGAGDIPTVAHDKLGDINSEEIQYWLVDGRNPAAGQETLRAIRQNPAPHVYLKPVVLLVADRTPDEVFLQQADAWFPFADIRRDLPRDQARVFQDIRRYVAGLPDAHNGSDTNLAFKVLRFLASRDLELAAHMTAAHRAGFVYPPLVPFFAAEDDATLRVLDFLDEQRLVRGEFQSKAHFCHHCASAFLNFQETCPHCGSADLLVDELIHHFKCAHTAPSRDFRQGDQLVCPKCTRQLRHIGVDYDKPSIVYSCNQCSHAFQDPTVDTTCYHCQRSTAPEHQVHREIRRYSVSAIGKNTAMYGLDTLFSSLLESELNLQGYDTFGAFFRLERARIARYHKSTSSLLMVSLADLDQVYLEAGARAKEIFGELGQLFRAVLRDSDVLTARSESVFVILLTETDVTSADRALERLRERLTELLEVNLGRDPNIQAELLAVEEDLDLDEAVERFLKSYVL